LDLAQYNRLQFSLHVSFSFTISPMYLFVTESSFTTTTVYIAYCYSDSKHYFMTYRPNRDNSVIAK